MAKTGFPNGVLRYDAPWRGTIKTWSLTFNHSGALLSAPQALTFLQALHNSVFCAFFSAAASSQYLSSYAYYDGTNSAALQEADYASAADSEAAGWNGVSTYGDAYMATPTGVSGLETCVVLKALVGTSKTGKPIWMRKFIHGVPPMLGDSDNAPLTGGAQALALALGDGTLPGNRVLCSAKGNQGTWEVETYFGNHKLFRAYNKSKAELTKIANDYLREASKIPGNILIPGGVAAD
jgi:hypothetical protein